MTVVAGCHVVFAMAMSGMRLRFPLPNGSVPTRFLYFSPRIFSGLWVIRLLLLSLPIAFVVVLWRDRRAGSRFTLASSVCATSSAYSEVHQSIALSSHSLTPLQVLLFLEVLDPLVALKWRAAFTLSVVSGCGFTLASGLMNNNSSGLYHCLYLIGVTIHRLSIIALLAWLYHRGIRQAGPTEVLLAFITDIPVPLLRFIGSTVGRSGPAEVHLALIINITVLLLDSIGVFYYPSLVSPSSIPRECLADVEDTSWFLYLNGVHGVCALRSGGPG